MECVFCKIVKGEIGADKVYEDSQTLAFLDIRPNNLGHTLVIPKTHYENIYSTPDEMLAATMSTVKKVAVAVKKGMAADGINVANNNEPAAGQLVFHTHIHIIPRYKIDGFKHWGHKEYSPEQMKEAAEKIKKAFE